MMEQLCTLRSAPATQFTDALVTNAGELESMAAPAALGGSSSRGRLKMLNLVATENRDYELLLFSGAVANTADAATNRFLGRWSFVAADAVRVAATGLYLYHINGLDVPYEDQDKTGLIHAMLVNRSAAAKSAGAPGALRIDLWFAIVP